MKPPKRSLKSEAVKNTTATMKNNHKETIDIKKGAPCDQSAKIEASSSVKFGMSKGATINMGDFESLRVDVWLTDDVQKGETLEQAFKRVSNTLDEVLDETTKDVMESVKGK